MAVNNQDFQNRVSQWGDDMRSLIRAINNWADNKADTSPKDSFGNPTFDFTAAWNALQAAKATFETSVTTVTGL